MAAIVSGMQVQRKPSRLWRAGLPGGHRGLGRQWRAFVFALAFWIPAAPSVCLVLGMPTTVAAAEPSACHGAAADVDPTSGSLPGPLDGSCCESCDAYVVSSNGAASGLDSVGPADGPVVLHASPILLPRLEALRRHDGWLAPPRLQLRRPLSVPLRI